MRYTGARAKDWSGVHGSVGAGPNPLVVAGRKVGRTFLGQLISGPCPLGLGQLVRGARPGPKVPTKIVRKNNQFSFIHILKNE